MTDLHIVHPSVTPAPTADAYAAACAALEKHRKRADAAEEVLRRVADVVGDLEGAACVDDAMPLHEMSRVEGIGYAVERIRDVLAADDEAGGRRG